MRIVVWGTYDTGKPRVRILLKGLRAAGVEVIECHQDVWGTVVDKSQVSGFASRLKLLARWIASYPGLLLRYLHLPRHDVVLCPYLGNIDVLVIWPFAKLRRTHIAWDAFLSLYDTVVEDRRMVSPRNPLALMLYGLEWLDCRAADTVFTDTNANKHYFVNRFGFCPTKVVRAFVGVEAEAFPPVSRDEYLSREERPFTVLFYGQFIALHGIEFIIHAAKQTEGEGIVWRIIGTGQEATRVGALIEKLKPENLDWVEWVEYRDLAKQIQQADVCLGIFGVSEKARRVIPNKVFQIISAGSALITGDSPAIRELLTRQDSVQLVPLGDSNHLADAVRAFAAREPQARRRPSFDSICARITPVMVVADLVAHLKSRLEKS